MVDAILTRREFRFAGQYGSDCLYWEPYVADLVAYCEYLDKIGHNMPFRRQFVLGLAQASVVTGDLFDDDLDYFVDAAVQSSCDDVLMEPVTRTRKHIQRDPADAIDADIVRMLDIVGARYHCLPTRLAQECTYRQLLYLFMFSHNALINEAIGRGADLSPKDMINAKGLLYSVEALSTKDKCAYYGRLSKEMRKNGK